MQLLFLPEIIQAPIVRCELGNGKTNVRELGAPLYSHVFRPNPRHGRGRHLIKHPRVHRYPRNREIFL
jgi:hypothetical protein